MHDGGYQILVKTSLLLVWFSFFNLENFQEKEQNLIQTKASMRPLQSDARGDEKQESFLALSNVSTLNKSVAILLMPVWMTKNVYIRFVLREVA